MNIVAELDTYGNIANWWIRGFGLLRDMHGVWFIHNGLGDVAALMNQAGQVLRRYRYSAFGVEFDPCPEDTNPWRYRGEYFDVETGMIYLRARHFNPRTGRFITADPYWGVHNMQNCVLSMLQASNLFLYTLNNPLRWIDPSGLKIVLPDNITAFQQQEFDRAIAYLKQSETFRALWDLIHNSGINFYLRFNSNHDARFVLNFVENTRTIHWDPTSGTILGDGRSVHSAALVFAHELGHAAQYLQGFITPNRTTQAIEVNNLRLWEIPIATELDEFVRQQYRDTSGVRRLGNSTDWGTVRPWWHYMGPWNWGRPSFQNLNTWTP